MIWLVMALEAVLAPLIALGVIVDFALSRRRAVLRDLLSELPERFGSLTDEARKRLAGRKVIWFHAASAGEVNGLRPLLQKMAHRFPHVALLVTTATVSGRDAARRIPEICWAQLAPIDALYCVSRFLKASGAQRLFLSETELWPTTIYLAHVGGLRPTLINGRLSSRGFKQYLRYSYILRRALRSLHLIYVQSDEDARRFVELGYEAAKIAIMGNTKYDSPHEERSTVAAKAAVAALGWETWPLIVAGSTHPVEEEIILSAFAPHREHARLVLAPRHVERAAEAFETTKNFGPGSVRWTEIYTRPPGVARVLVLDVMGELAGFWPMARLACVGGTWVPVGGHNVVEPAQAGVPVAFGQHTRHVEYPAELLVRGGGGFQVRTQSDLTMLFERFINLAAVASEAGVNARRSAASLRGASERLLAVLDL